MPPRIRPFPGLALALAGVVVASSPSDATADVPLPHEGGVHHRGPQHRFAGQHGATEEARSLEPMDARLWLIAPSPTGPWTLRIDNVSENAIRIPADARLLRLEISPAAGSDGKAGKKVSCEAPSGLRPKSFPEERALVLQPGESYVETFDPHLFCFGKKSEALEGGALVRPRFGWDPPASWDRRPAKAPFAVANLDLPADGRSQRELAGPAIVLSHGDDTRKSYAGEEPAHPHKKGRRHKPGHKGKRPPTKHADLTAPGEPRDYNTPRLEVDTQKFEDASGASDISVVVHAKNDGRREMLAALRSRMLSFEVTGPILLDAPRRDRQIECPAPAPRNATPREMFKSYRPDESVSFNVLVAELCPKNTFLRPGLYRVRPTLHATQSGAELGLKAHTETSRSLHETLVRVHTGRLPYHLQPPRAVPTDRLVAGVLAPPPPGASPSADEEVESAWGGSFRRSRGAPKGGGSAASPPPFIPQALEAVPPPPEPSDPSPPPEMPSAPPVLEAPRNIESGE
jgi:hypothetical protein